VSRKYSALLVVLLIAISVFNIGAAYGERNFSSSKIPVVTQDILKYPLSEEVAKTNPREKVDPQIFEILKTGGGPELPTIKGTRYLPIYIVASDEIDIKVKHIRIVGRTEIAGTFFYLALVPINRDSEKDILKIASFPQVESITRTNPVEPVGVIKDPDFKASSNVLKVKVNVPKIQRPINLGHLEKLSVKTLRMPAVMEYRQKSPLRKGELKIATRTIPRKPDDIFAIYHQGALNAWNKLGITGAGVNVAVIDSGVDFGNPDLEDAYAVDQNPNSPYYGWPIAYSGHSMIWYLLLNETFPSYIYSWYADTSIELPYYLIAGNVSVGYKGNYTTVFTTMSLANIIDDTQRARFINETLNWIGVKNTSRILLVDDDGNTSMEVFYKEAFKLLNLSVDEYEVLPANASGPNLTVLSKYDIVVWFTGFQYKNVLTPTDISNLEKYLQNHGKLWLISEDLLSEIPVNSTFVREYLHVTSADQDYPVPTVVKTPRETYRGGSIYYGLYGSPTDAFADFINGDNESYVLAIGYEALVAIGWRDPDTGNVTEMTIIKFPLSNNLTVPSKSGNFHFGLHPDLALWADWNGGYIILADPTSPENYTELYADITPLTIQTEDMNLTYVDFNEDTGHGKDSPIIQVDFWDARAESFGHDGYADLSGGMIYFIADGKTPLPYSDVVASRWGFDLTIPGNGNLVAFMIGTEYIGGGDHGTLCAAAVGARGRTYGGLTYGTAIGAKIIAEGSLYSGGSWIDYVFFAVQGYDGKPGTGDEALVVSNSYGMSSIIAKGYTWDDRFLYYITHLYTPWVSFLFAAGNGGPGYGTVTSNGASPGVITVGASVEWGYRALLGYDNGPWGEFRANYGDVADFSNRGPNALGVVKPDVLAVGEFAFGSLPLNEVGNGLTASDLWAGTSLATPMAAGITALVYQAYHETYGTWPTEDTVKEILMSTARNVNNDVFTQGAGFLNAYAAVMAAMKLDGIVVSPSTWQPGKTNYQAFANVLTPGESSSQTFKIHNMNYSAAKNVTISAEIFKKIGEVEINVEGNSWNMYRIDQYIPQGTDLMKITLYTDYSNFDPGRNYTAEAYPWFRVYDVTIINGSPTFNLLQQASKEGTVTSATIGDPLQKFHDEMVVQIRDIFRFYGKTETYPAKLKLEFYRRVPWGWVNVSNSTLTVPAGNFSTFTARITVPEDTPYGIYEGAIYIKHDGTETTIPVSVVVVAPKENFEFGNNRVSSGLYDNSNVYGYFDWGWRYESGDWRLLYFNVTENNTPGKYLIVGTEWEGKLNDINLHVLGPSEDTWSDNIPSIFGPYTLEQIGGSDDGYVTRGLFKWQTTSGSSAEVVAVPFHKGLNAVWLHNVLFDGKSAATSFRGFVGTVEVTPYEWIEETPLQMDEKEFIFKKTLDLGQINVQAYGLTKPKVYENQLAPKTDESDYYYVNVSDSAMLHVAIWSDWDTKAGLDLDLIVYYYDPIKDKYIMMGSSLTPTADESVTIKFPQKGIYVIEVNAYNNPAYGNATYNLSILSLEKKNNIGAKLERIDKDTYKIKASYKLNDTEFNEGGTYYGAIFIGASSNPLLVAIPVQITINPEVAVIQGEEHVKIREGYSKTVALNLSTNKPVGALQLKLLYDPTKVKIDGISISERLKEDVTMVYNVNNTKGIAEIGLVAPTGIGSGTLLNLNLTGISQGNTTIEINVVDAADIGGAKMKVISKPVTLQIYHKRKGDANGDGKITAVDSLIYLRYAVGLPIAPYHLDPVEDDVTGDGRITAADALVVLRAAVGLESLN